MMYFSANDWLLCLVALTEIVQDATHGDDDAMDALSDDFWVMVITMLDGGTVRYGSFMGAVRSKRRQWEEACYDRL